MRRDSRSGILKNVHHLHFSCSFCIPIDPIINSNSKKLHQNHSFQKIWKKRWRFSLEGVSLIAFCHILFPLMMCRHTMQELMCLLLFMETGIKFGNLLFRNYLNIKIKAQSKWNEHAWFTLIHERSILIYCWLIIAHIHTGDSMLKASPAQLQLTHWQLSIIQPREALGSHMFITCEPEGIYMQYMYTLQPYMWLHVYQTCYTSKIHCMQCMYIP